MNTPKLSKTKAWFKGFQKLLDERSTYRRQMKSAGAPNYAVYNVGDYSFQPWKVIWPEMSTRFYAAVAGSAEVPVIGSRPFVPDHKVYFVAFNDKETAYFLCGLLNSPMVREWIESHNVSIQVGDIFKHLKLPEYSPANATHVELRQLVESAHREHEKALRKVLISDIEAKSEQVLLSWLNPLHNGDVDDGVRPPAVRFQ